MNAGDDGARVHGDVTVPQVPAAEQAHCGEPWYPDWHVPVAVRRLLVWGKVAVPMVEAAHTRPMEWRRKPAVHHQYDISDARTHGEVTVVDHTPLLSQALVGEPAYPLMQVPAPDTPADVRGNVANP